MSARIAVALAGAMTLLSAPLDAHAECRMTRIAQLPFDVAHGHKLVTATLNGGDAHLIFDTGAYTSILSEAVTDRLQLRRMQGEEIHNTLGVVGGIGGKRHARMVTARRVELGGLRARDYNFIASDIGLSWADGLLSVDLISQFDVDLDFPESRIVLYRPTGDGSAPAAFLSGPLYSAALEPIGVDRRPRVKVDVAGHSLTALLDTGAERSAITRRAAERLGQAIVTNGPARRNASGLGPERVAATPAAMSDLSVGDLSFDRMPVEVLDTVLDDGVDLILGADFQARVHVWISYSSHTLIMQYPAKPSKSVSTP